MIKIDLKPLQELGTFDAMALIATIEYQLERIHLDSQALGADVVSYSIPATTSINIDRLLMRK